jgi:mevalonate kinase
MNMNHALLDSLGVGHPALTRLVLAARSAGAFGAKITGAGGGGCMIALAPSRARGRVVEAIRACNAQAIVTTLDTEGARRENNG